MDNSQSVNPRRMRQGRYLTAGPRRFPISVWVMFARGAVPAAPGCWAGFRRAQRLGNAGSPVSSASHSTPDFTLRPKAVEKLVLLAPRMVRESQSSRRPISPVGQGVRVRAPD